MCRGVHPLVCLDQSRWESFLRDRIEKRAYYLWQHAGCPRNHEIDFWVRAKELEFRMYAFSVIYKMGLQPTRSSPCKELANARPDRDCPHPVHGRDH